MSEFWYKDPADFNRIEKEVRKLILHPVMAGIIKDNNYREVLDYGCGDGTLELLLPRETKLSLYDVNRESLQLATENLREWDHEVYYDPGEIKHHRYDCVVFSLVLMTLGDRGEISRCLQDFQRYLRPGGELIVAVSHPCFREKDFSTFSTEFGKTKPFLYHREGERFEVTIRNEKTGQTAVFHDFHWTLATTVNLMIEAGFTIAGMLELMDQGYEEEYYNQGFPPFLVVRGRKS